MLGFKLNYVLYKEPQASTVYLVNDNVIFFLKKMYY